MTKLTRREKEQMSHRLEIMDAALELFSKNGYHNVTMQHIATYSEFAIGTLYKFFKSKELLYEALLLKTSHTYFTRINAAMLIDGSIIDKIRNYVYEDISFVATNLEVARLLISQIHGTDNSSMVILAEEIQKYNQTIEKLLVTIMEQGIADGIFRKLCPAIMARSLFGALNASFLHFLNDGIELDLRTYSDKIVDIFFRGVSNEV